MTQLLQFFILGDWQILRNNGLLILRGADPYASQQFFYPLPLGLWLLAPLVAQLPSLWTLTPLCLLALLWLADWDNG